ncbi:MAG: DUF4365 domain-containing protein [Saprospiraceae bacterium]|nr:DUF4365 domain-containing protein [Saprospiraceae bacterium]
MIKQTEAQQLGRAGERWFQSVVPREWIFQKPEEDIGIDGKITVGTSEKIGSFEFAVQIKASKNWQIVDNIITVEGIKTDTISYWGSRLYPTLLVLFDDTKKIGYYAWVFDIINQPIEFAVPINKLKQKTTSLKVRSNQIIDENAFLIIYHDVIKFFEKFVFSLQQLRKNINILPTISKLSEAIRGIYLSHMQTPKNKDEAMYLSVLMVKSHTEVIQAMDELQNIYQLEIGSKDYIKYFIASYINEVNLFISEFDKFVHKQNGVGAIWVNDEVHKKNTPKLIDLIFDLLITLTATERKNNRSIFTFT